MLKASDALRELRSLGNPEDAKFLQRFFKTGRGQYGEGDVFLGIRVPATRAVATKYREVPLDQVKQLLQASEHEARLLALVILTMQYTRAEAAGRQQIFDFYLANTAHINNWDLVDASAGAIVGAHLFGQATSLLDELAASDNLWERRIAIVATHYFIRRGDFGETTRIARQLLRDDEDLIHKATGWMLREVGKKDEATLVAFLDEHCRQMPRTMLRYAIERFSLVERKRYLAR